MPRTAHWMMESGFVVCLDAPAEVIRARLALADDRPLAGDWEALLDKRRAAYAAIPIHIDTSDKTPEDIAEEIVRLMAQRIPVKTPNGQTSNGRYEIVIERGLLANV